MQEPPVGPMEQGYGGRVVLCRQAVECLKGSDGSRAGHGPAVALISGLLALLQPNEGVVAVLVEEGVV
jgi:hypothetical protein